VEDVARAFDCVLHRGVTGKIYNIGGTHEKANIEVAKDVIRVMKLDKKEVRGRHTLSIVTLCVQADALNR
jgi:dTDP-D-glucose 4,6-dehydratase